MLGFFPDPFFCRDLAIFYSDCDSNTNPDSRNFGHRIPKCVDFLSFPYQKFVWVFSSSVINLAWNSLQSHISNYQQLFALLPIPLLQDLQRKKLSLRFSLCISLISANKREIVFFWLTAMNQYCVTQGRMRLHRRGQTKVSLRSKGFGFFICKMTYEVVK